MELGLWPDFVAFRDLLKGEGVPNALANKQAVERYLGRDTKKKIEAGCSQGDDRTPDLERGPDFREESVMAVMAVNEGGAL